MPSEPDPNIDPLLRAYAKQRQEAAGAPFELHPATRHLLQAEVARRFPAKAPAPESRPKSSAGWWLRLAWGSALVGVLAAAALILVPPPIPPPDIMRPAPRAAPTMAPASVAPPKPPSPARSRSAPIASGALARSGLSPAANSLANQVLTTFELEQKADQVRIVDADGSIYLGQIIREEPSLRHEAFGAAAKTEVNALAAPSPSAALKNKPSAERVSEPDTESRFFFRAAGTNRSLNQSVVINGQLIVENHPRAGPSEATVAAPSPSAILPGSANSLWSNSPSNDYRLGLPQRRLQGHALIGGTNPIELNAIPATR